MNDRSGYCCTDHVQAREELAGYAGRPLRNGQLRVRQVRKQGFGSGIFPNPGSGSLYLKRREIFKRIRSECFRYYQKTPFLFSYFCCQTSPESARATEKSRIRNPVRKCPRYVVIVYHVSLVSGAKARILPCGPYFSMCD